VKGRPNKTPASSEAPGRARTWRPNATFSIKNRFRLPNWLFERRAIDFDASTKFIDRPTIGDHLDARTQDQV